MISEFNLLSEKISRLATLAHSLRQENTDLRLQVASQGQQHAALLQRMDEAQQRIHVLLETLPEPAIAPEQEKTA